MFEGSLRAVYIESCKKVGVIPASYFLRHMDDTQIEMKHHGLGPQGIKPIAIALVVSTSNKNDAKLKSSWKKPGGVPLFALPVCVRI